MRFTVKDVAAEAAGEEDTVSFHFTLTEGQQSVTDEWRMESEDLAGITIESEEFPEHVTVCADRWFIFDLPQERGGWLFVAERANGGLALSQQHYDGGDEDSATITLLDGLPWVSTHENGARALELPMSAPGLAPGTGAPVMLSCESDDPQGLQQLTLRLDSSGQLRAVNYGTIMSGAHGTSCDVSAWRGSEEQTWRDSAGQTDIHWNEKLVKDSTLRVRYEGGVYRVDTHGVDFTYFCGQSAQLALSVSLKPGSKTCDSAEWPEVH